MILNYNITYYDFTVKITTNNMPVTVINYIFPLSLKRSILRSIIPAILLSH